MADREKLENGLILRTVENKCDVERVVEFNTRYNNANEGFTCRCLLEHHPGMRWEDFRLVEDEKSGEVVSTTCLIPWECKYEGITLKTAMLEMVLTHPRYRKLGLVRMQIERFHQAVRENGYDLSVIWGIPYYYRQFGYTYCIYGNAADVLSVDKIPEADYPEEDYTLRKAHVDDIPAMSALYNEVAAHQQFHVIRRECYWKYMLVNANFPVYMVEYKTRNPAGYVIYQNSGDRAVSILESGVTSKEAGIAIFRMLKKKAARDAVIKVSWPENSTLVQIARQFGSIADQPGQWLVRIPDISSFLRKIKPVFEKRLWESDFNGINTDIIINLYKEAYRIVFRSGKLLSIENIGFKDASMGADGGDLCIPPDAFVRLVFGFRTLNELTDAWPDIVIKAQSRRLLDVLFPRIASYIHMPYHYQTLDSAFQ